MKVVIENTNWSVLAARCLELTEHEYQAHYLRTLIHAQTIFFFLLFVTQVIQDNKSQILHRHSPCHSTSIIFQAAVLKVARWLRKACFVTL